MKNPTRRNRNIGTFKQGHGQNNKLVIPYPVAVMKEFQERLTQYTKTFRTINGTLFEFVVEETRQDTQHACTVDDIAEILRHVSPKDYGRLNLVVLRQPKRKEEILNAVWGRLIYYYYFETDFDCRPAIILEAMPTNKVLKWSKSLNPDRASELKRLEEDGHRITTTKRHHLIHTTLDSVRNTQLYRTLPHEIGHYKHFLELVGELEDTSDDALYEKHEAKQAKYDNLPTAVKEKYAHNYADRFKVMLEQCGSIPFDRIEPINEAL